MLVLTVQAPGGHGVRGPSSTGAAAQSATGEGASATLKARPAQAYRRELGACAPIGADRLHQVGITGRGVTVALIDSGLGADAVGLAKSLSNASIDTHRRRASRAPRATATPSTSPKPWWARPADGEGAVGVAYEAQVLSIRADSDGACSKECAFSSLNLAKAVDYALSKKRQASSIPVAWLATIAWARSSRKALAHAVKRPGQPW